MMPGVNYIIYGCSSARTTLVVGITILELHTGGEYYCSYYPGQDDKWQFEKTN